MDIEKLNNVAQGEALAIQTLVAVLIRTLREKGVLTAEELSNIHDEVARRIERGPDDGVTQQARKAAERLAKARQPPRSSGPQ